MAVAKPVRANGKTPQNSRGQKRKLDDVSVEKLEQDIRELVS